MLKSAIHELFRIATRNSASTTSAGKRPWKVTLRQRHLAGEKTFLDWAGKTLSWTNPESGHDQPAFLFVSVLGASDYIFAEAFADQKLAAWIEAHIHMAQFYGGVTRLWVPDNATTGVVKPCYSGSASFHLTAHFDRLPSYFVNIRSRRPSHEARFRSCSQILMT